MGHVIFNTCQNDSHIPEWVVAEIRNYEAILVLKELNKEAQTKTFDSVYSNLEKKGAEILQTENWGVKDLFHPTSKMSKGNFNFLRFNIIGEKIKEVYSELKLNSNIIKIFILRVQRGK